MRAKKIRMIRLKVREIAESKGITRTMLSRRAEVNYETVNGIWNNPTREVSLKVLVRIAKVLDVPVTSLYEEINEES